MKGGRIWGGNKALTRKCFQVELEDQDIEPCVWGKGQSHMGVHSALRWQLYNLGKFFNFSSSVSSDIKQKS